MRRLLAAMAVCVLWGQVASAQETLSYTDLVKRLTDMERLAVTPQAGEKCVQWSSYDRASKYDADSGKYVHWGANGDGGGIIRREGETSVFAEMKGPGVIWRIWSAKADKGHVKIYLDGAEKPTVDLPFDDYFNGKTEPFVYGKALCHTTASGRNCYVPIGFQKSCKIVADKGWGNYYHFTYTVYPKGTKVPTFSLPIPAADAAALKAADEALAGRLGTDPAGPRDGSKDEKRSVEVAAGKTATVAELSGPRAICLMKVKMDFDDREDEMAALRELVVRITWDGEGRPSVWAPLGDFFGSAPGVNLYKSLPLGMTKDGFYSAWYMPFARSAKIELVNEGAKDRKAAFEIVHAPLGRPIEKLGRFHAKWHRDVFNPTGGDRVPDWTMLQTTGRGRFCGVMLHVWNPKGGWWGEGDEKFFVDGEKFPSTIGTGSEDYFGYAWCNPQLFQNAYHNQTISNGNRGHVSVNRWHITDNVPFQTSFEAAIEKYYPNRRPTLYAAIAYWYQAVGQKDPYQPVAAADRWGYCIAPEVVGVKGALEGEKLKVLERTGGGAQVQDMGSFAGGQWSGEAHLWWTGAKVGDKLTLAVPAKADGKFELKARLTKARDYGIVQLSLDGKKLGDPIDLYNPEVVPTKELNLGTHELTKGTHKLTIEITGANAKADKAYMVGVDYVLLKPAD